MLKFIATIFICLTFSCFAGLEIGETVCSPKQCYIIKKLLGQGAFGKVFLVADGKKNYALKSYTADHGNGNSFWELLGNTEREYQRGKMLSHPNIVKPIELFTSDENANLVLEYIDGLPLFNIEENTVPYEKNRTAIHHFIEALLYGISIDLLHLDLHGGNIMLTKTQDVKVIDLASFFTIKEILNFEKRENERNVRGFHGAIPQPLMHKELKIQKFFDENPDLLEELLQIDEEEEINEDFLPQDGMRKRAVISQKQNAVYAAYFSRVSYMCIEIIGKANLADKKRNAIVEKIKLLQEEYSNLATNKKIINVADYFNKLKKLIN